MSANVKIIESSLPKQLITIGGQTKNVYGLTKDYSISFLYRSPIDPLLSIGLLFGVQHETLRVILSITFSFLLIVCSRF